MIGNKWQTMSRLIMILVVLIMERSARVEASGRHEVTDTNTIRITAGQKLNPALLFGNANDPVPTEDYRPGAPTG